MRVSDSVRSPFDESCVSALDGEYVRPPDHLAPGPEGRLIEQLRGHARSAGRQGPIHALGQAAGYFYMARHGDPHGRLTELGDLRVFARAVADLAVTGRAAYARFRADPPDVTRVRDEAQLRLSRRFDGSLNERSLQTSAEDAVERAYKVAWALRGPVGWRTLNRRALRWIAVSGEDDPPHRPVNVASAPFPQYDLTVPCNVRGRTINVETRFMIASPDFDPRSFDLGAIDLDAVPPDPTVTIGADKEIIIYIHGHSSRLEESLDLVPWLHRIGAEHGKRYCIIAMDQPSCGYASMIDHTSVAPTSWSQWHLGDGPSRPTSYPILDFIETFITTFVDVLDRQVPVKERIVAVVGGSLGGNMVLRLSQRDQLHRHGWLQNRVAWSPASVWDPLVNDILKDRVTEVPHGEMVEEERKESRQDDYFKPAFDGFYHFVPVPPQSKSWYRDSWPCKGSYIEAARLDRREIYNPALRRWHWRVAYEQLIYSHRDPEAPGGQPRYRTLSSRLLLLAGEKDDDHFLEIHDAARDLAQQIPHVQGQGLFLQETGHSIHNERPRYLAGKIVDFLDLPQAQPGRRLLYQWWSSTRGDNFTTSDDRWAGAVGDGVHGYQLSRIAGQVFDPALPQPPNTVPLVSWWSPSRGDNFTTSDPSWQGTIGGTRPPDYRLFRVEGYAYDPDQPQPPNTVPLVSWWSPSRGDHSATSDPSWRGRPGDTRPPDYTFVRLLGYVEPV
jgi:hypothetical protein